MTTVRRIRDCVTPCRDLVLRRGAGVAGRCPLHPPPPMTRDVRRSCRLVDPGEVTYAPQGSHSKAVPWHGHAQSGGSLNRTDGLPRRIVAPVELVLASAAAFQGSLQAFVRFARLAHGADDGSRSVSLPAAVRAGARASRTSAGRILATPPHVGASLRTHGDVLPRQCDQEQSMPERCPPPGVLLVLPFLDGPRTVVVVAGQADQATAARLHEELIDTVSCGTRSLVVDLTDLASCDPQGADALTRAVQVAEARGVAVTLRGQSAQVAQMLRTYPHRA